MTLLELAKHIVALIEENPSNAHKQILLSDDEEGNSYHSLYFGFTVDTNTVKDCIEYSNGADVNIKDYSKYAILG